MASWLNTRSEGAFSDSAYIPILFATNRQARSGKDCDDRAFGVKGSASITYGACDINVPRKHTVGALDSSDEARTDRHTYFFTGSRTAMNDESFFKSVDSDKETLLFVHGFNVRFEEAIIRAAQMKYDLKFSGQIIVFTWPAGADDGLLDSIDMAGTYRQNLEQAKATRTKFQEFLEKLTDRTNKVHIVVHSMGHQVVLPSLNQFAGNHTFKMGELILNAPDFPVSEFQTVAPVIRPLFRRITLYCSPGDNALVVSQKVNSARRVGQCAKIPDVDVINVNEVDAPTLGIGGLGHGYYAGRAILIDVYQTLLGMDVKKRLFIRVSTQDGGENYVMRR